MQHRPRAVAENIVSIERLNYGKLAVGADLRIPASEGFGVTRRSLGLSPRSDRDFSPATLMGLRRFEPDHLDPQAKARGGLLGRIAPPRFGDLAPLVLMRARFRPEDGDVGQGRLYQQSAVWALDAECWRRHPAALLAIAETELQATPDLVGEDAQARFSAEPLRRRLDRRSAAPVRASAAAFMLDVLCDYAWRPDGCVATFGEGCDFASEAEFLATLGHALALLPQDYPRWRDIGLVSGLRCTTPGVCFRYLPSSCDPAAAGSR